MLAVQAHRGLFGLLRLQQPSRRRRAAPTSCCELVDLRASADVPAELLSHGQQRQLEIAVALGSRPRLLLLDEPSSGMSAHERAGLGDLLKRVVNTATVVMAEHDVHVVRTVATRVTAFAEGKKIAEGSADDVFDSADVQARLPARSTRCLKSTDLHAYYGASHVVQGITFSIERGEAVALMGRNGVGKTSTLKSIMGLETRTAGAIRFDGRR